MSQPLFWVPFAERVLKAKVSSCHIFVEALPSFHIIQKAPRLTLQLCLAFGRELSTAFTVIHVSQPLLLGAEKGADLGTALCKVLHEFGCVVDLDLGYGKLKGTQFLMQPLIVPPEKL